MKKKKVPKASWIPYEDLEAKLLSDPEVKREYDRLAPEYEVISEMIRLRLETGITQKELAKKIGTTQSSIARLITQLANGEANPTFKFLQRIASGYGARLKISFV